MPPTEGWFGRILERFRGLVQTRQGWRAFCPAHQAGYKPHRLPSLSIWVGRQRDRVVIGCWANCRKEDVLHAAGLRMQDLFAPEEKAVQPTPRRVVVATYPYVSEHGELLYEVLRYQPKDFRQRRPVGDNWAWGLSEGVYRPNGGNLYPVRFGDEQAEGDVKLAECPRILYRLPQLFLHPEWPVCISEGEKDADNLAELGWGVCPTTMAGGTGCGWRDEYSETLRGRRVAVVYDNDEAGLKHADRVIGSLLRHGTAEVRGVILPGECKDVSDWLASGRPKEELRAVFSAAKAWRS